MLQKKLHQRKNQNIGKKAYDKNQIDVRAAQHPIWNTDFSLPKGRNTP